jgi:hypothetical protein
MLDGMGMTHEDLPTHEGYADRRMPDNTFSNGEWSARFPDSAHVAFVAACSCAWRSTTEHPATDAGEEAAKQDWYTDHAQPLLGRIPSARLLDDIEALRLRLAELVEQRPLAGLTALRQVSDWAAAQTRRGVGRARDNGSTWREIAEQLGVTAQAAQQRYATLADRDGY